MFDHASISGARLCRERYVESRQAVRLLASEGQTMVDSGPAESIRQLSRALRRPESSKYGGQMQSRRSCKEETEETHEMGHQNMASLGGFLSVLW